MNQPSTDTWETLFTPEASGERRATVPLRALYRAGKPFLILPASNSCAAMALGLYPAQTLKARAAKFVLGLALRAGQSPRLKRTSLNVDPNDPFVRFLTKTARLPEGEIPAFAVLAGNPNTEGRRFVILLFDVANEPVAVVKVGCSATARRLITHEGTFLRSAPPHVEGLPKLGDTFVSSRLDAFAIDYMPGHSPGLADTAPLAKLLSSWLTVGRLAAMSELPAWQRLTHAATSRVLPKPVQALESARFHAPLVHGDCTPWNVKVSHGHWRLLDWERGELMGVPTWDWLHYVTQSAVLVRRESIHKILDRLERVLASDAFLNYTRQAAVAGREKELALGYLCYCTRVLRQSEGGEQILVLEQAALQRWFP